MVHANQPPLTDRQLVTALIAWCENDAPDAFDDKFIRSVSESLDKYHELTMPQRRALWNIAVQWEISLESYL